MGRSAHENDNFDLTHIPDGIPGIPRRCRQRCDNAAEVLRGMSRQCGTGFKHASFGEFGVLQAIIPGLLHVPE